MTTIVVVLLGEPNVQGAMSVSDEVSFLGLQPLVCHVFGLPFAMSIRSAGVMELGSAVAVCASFTAANTCEVVTGGVSAETVGDGMSVSDAVPSGPAEHDDTISVATIKVPSRRAELLVIYLPFEFDGVDD